MTVIHYTPLVNAMNDGTEAKLTLMDKLQAIEQAVNAHSLISFANLQGKIIYVNDLFCATSKYAREELMGRDHGLLNSGYHPKGFFAEMYKMVAKGQIWKGEVRNRAKDGSFYWVATTILPVFNAEGKMHQYVSIRMDITEQKLKNIDFAGQLAAISRSQTALELDMDGMILNANTNFLNAMGYTLEEIVGKHHSIFVDSIYRKTQEYKNFWEKLNLGLFEAAEYKRIDKNNKEVWFQAAYNPILDLNGKPKKIVEYATDITLQKKNIEESTRSMQKAIEGLNSQNRIRAGIEELINSIRGELTASELGNNILSSFANLIGIQIGAFYILTNNRLELIASYAYKKRKNLANVFDIGEGLVGQCAREKKTIIISNVPDDYVKISSGLGESSPGTIMVVPITFEKKLLGILEIGKINEFSEEETKIVETCIENIGITLNSAKARDQVQELLKESKKQAMEMQAQQQELKTTNEELAAQQEQLSKSNAALEEQAQRLTRSEASIAKKNEELKKTTLSLEKQTREIEEKSALVEEAKQAIEMKARELELSSKYKSEFLANMSHELRTPLNSLLILSKILSSNEEGNLTADQVESAQIIYKGGSDLLSLINDILDLSKVEAGKLEINLEDVTCETLINNVYRQFAPIAKDKKLKFIVDKSKELSSLVHTDLQRTEQILKNFLSNAFKFTAEGGVTIRVHAPEAMTKFQRNSLSRENSIGISISDTGIGIAKPKQKMIFEAFQQGDGRTSRVYGGTGLGLSISQELAKILGHEIQLQSIEGEGSTFTLYLPLRNKAGLSEKNKIPTAETPFDGIDKISVPQPTVRTLQKRQESINFFDDDRNNIADNDKVLLIIEDDINYAKILLNYSRKRGYKCLVTASGKDSLRLAGQYKPHGITLDMNLPDLPGELVLKQLKSTQETMHIPIHIVSASQDLHLCGQTGAVGFLKKSANIEELETIFTSLQKQHPEGIKKILVVEDDAGNQKIITDLLKSKAVSPHIVSLGAQACQQISSEKFDCVILDLNLPDMTGFEVLETLGNEILTKLPPIIIYTGHDLSKAEFQRLSEFTETVIIKGPSSSERLLDELSIFLHSVERSHDTVDLPKRPENTLEPGEILQNKKVLIVDDDMRNTFALTALLRRKGLEVVMAENGQKALDKLESTQGIDIVIMDIMMPIMDGYEAIRRIRENSRFIDLPIIALTAKVLPEDKAKALKCGANDFLTKPVDMDQLLQMMCIWLYEAINK